MLIAHAYCTELSCVSQYDKHCMHDIICIATNKPVSAYSAVSIQGTFLRRALIDYKL